MSIHASYRARALALLVVPVLFLAACDEDSTTPTPDPAVVSLQFVHKVGSADLTEDQLLYTNTPGNPYSVTKLEYLITDITLVGAPAKHEVTFDAAVYDDAFAAGSHTFLLGNLEAEEYSGLQFRWGVEASNNVAGNLDSTFDGMLWPVANGGGYHCMRFEGDYTTAGSQTPGDGSFALHMGKLQRVDGTTDGAVLIDLDNLAFTAEAGKRYVIQVALDVNAFMDDPEYDFDAPGDVDNGNGGVFPLAFPSMPSHMAQGLLRDNMDNVFSVVSVTEVTE